MMLLLASQSPRRAELLKQIGIPFSQYPVDIDETVLAHENPDEYVRRMAQEKSNLGYKRAGAKKLVLGADTIVVAQGNILGKPKDKTDAMRMLNILSDNTHQVFTAVTITSGKQQKTIVVETQVCFGPLSTLQMAWYWKTGEPQDKAGSYGIQGLGGQFVKHINGSYSAVVGLPLYQTRMLLTEFGILNEC
ncbi:septum formation protein [Paraglaciecola arctica BSs20135]|uniref:dTTP/UTP pyrophosphatase n=2 Tax=Paraglaciecola TaxID=1621534 RepID=K6Y3Q4_9ALTE|nr:septum formation protein [Paraglaciecola arctica BSs20135]|tara:strand:- start:3025 stop:3597 length:573 start_codon:yes stop_codon:yes gene_type:complete